MVLSPGDKVHVISRRLFDGDLRRHFAGEVEALTGELARLFGYAFVFDPNTNSYARQPEKRRRIIGLASDGLIINVLPATIEIESVTYKRTADGRLVFTDGAAFTMDVNEFGTRR